MCERVLKDKSNSLEELLPQQVKDRYQYFPETVYELCNIVRIFLFYSLYPCCGRFSLHYVTMQQVVNI